MAKIEDSKKSIMNIYVGNLPYKATDEELRDMFTSFGDVVSARVITDHETGRSKGFGFVEMSDDEQAKAAIEELNGVELTGRPLTVNEARPRQPRGPRRDFNNDRY
jgi:RNA recognition motif-containing protein